MNKYILKNIYRPSEDTLKDYRKYDVSTVYEAQDKTGTDVALYATIDRRSANRRALR